MSRIFARARRGLLLAAALAVAAALSGGTAAHAATAAASSTPCTFGPATSCESTDPTVTVNLHNSGASACTFTWHVGWGDGKVSDVVITDPPDGYGLLGLHTYVKTGAYTISATGQVTSGGAGCTVTNGDFFFTLDQIPTSGSGPATGATYVALGDSYSSGEGLGPFQAGTDVISGLKQNTCHRSASGAYSDLSPAIVLPQVTDRAFWACSGATTQDMMWQVPETTWTPNHYGQPRQLTTIGSTTKYITVTVGGDNVEFSKIGYACVTLEVGIAVYLSGDGCSAQLKVEEKKLSSLQINLATLYKALLNRAAPGAELVVAGYPKIFPSSFKGLGKLNGNSFCTFDHLTGVGTLGMLVTNAQQVAAFEANLNTAIQKAVTSAAKTYPGQVKYSNIYPTSVPRNCKGTTSNATVAGFELARGTGTGPHGLISTATFHPTKAGQKVYANAIEKTFLSFDAVA
jgi:hypothetical protein